MGEPDARVWAGEKEIDGRKVTGFWKDVETKPDVLLRGGERIGSLEVVPSPGHTLRARRRSSTRATAR